MKGARFTESRPYSAIAGQIDLLPLNTAIEAAKAGERARVSGRGRSPQTGGAVVAIDLGIRR